MLFERALHFWIDSHIAVNSGLYAQFATVDKESKRAPTLYKKNGEFSPHSKLLISMPTVFTNASMEETTRMLQYAFSTIVWYWTSIAQE